MRPLRLALEWFQNPDHVPFFLAQREGWLKDAGLELELIEPREHTSTRPGPLWRAATWTAITEPIHLVQIASGHPHRRLHPLSGHQRRRDDLDGLGVERPGTWPASGCSTPAPPAPAAWPSCAR
ncbi:MAG: ABC transporter substrate-binding protein [Deltaproteobacteria bacterium]|nr:ABC transporter substrate-binding protein [Deltaproteobacteria bacterium]